MSLSYAIGSSSRPAHQQRKGKSSVSKTKQSAAVTGVKTKPTTSPKPRVVTLANLTSRKQTSRDRGKKATASNVRTPNKTTKMWDESPDESEGHTLNATGRNSLSVRGHRNASSSGYGTQGRLNRVSSLNSPAARSGLTDESETYGQPKPDEERRESYNTHGGYTLVQPNPKKREKLQNDASQELERLAAYKEKQKVDHVSIKPGRVGGSKMSEEEVRRQQHREQEKKKFDQIRKRQQWAEEKKAREDKEYDEKKARARQQAERNKEKEKQWQRDMTYDRQRWMERGGLEKLESVEGAKRPGSEDEELGPNESSLEALKDMFPFKDPEKLKDMLKAAKGDVNKVVDWLSN